MTILDGTNSTDDASETPSRCNALDSVPGRTHGPSERDATMLPYIESFEPQDRERLFRFLTLFARWECALKHSGFAKRGSYGQAEPNWSGFASHHAAAVAALSEEGFIAARTALVANPPRREELDDDGVHWRANPRRDSETDAGYLFRIVRDVRNNLFHGGKFAGSSEPELARDRLLIDSASTVLQSALSLDERIREMFEKPA